MRSTSIGHPHSLTDSLIKVARRMSRHRVPTVCYVSVGGPSDLRELVS